ncbi:hypothetical protein D1872_310900 [compost metagenome]
MFPGDLPVSDMTGFHRTGRQVSAINAAFSQMLGANRSRRQFGCGDGLILQHPFGNGSLGQMKLLNRRRLNLPRSHGVGVQVPNFHNSVGQTFGLHRTR